jgi:hypothetical protein
LRVQVEDDLQTLFFFQQESVDGLGRLAAGGVTGQVTALSIGTVSAKQSLTDATLDLPQVADLALAQGAVISSHPVKRAISPWFTAGGDDPSDAENLFDSTPKRGTIAHIAGGGRQR